MANGFKRLFEFVPAFGMIESMDRSGQGGGDSSPKQPDLLTSPRELFRELVEAAADNRNTKLSPLVQTYLVELLDFYVFADNLYAENLDGRRTQSTLAELYFLASNAPRAATRNEALKRLADSSLYICGFFGESLSRKLVAVDYYVDMGGLAYGQLARQSREQIYAQVFSEFSDNFLQYVDLLTFISDRSLSSGEENILHLFDRYMKTGSAYAREQILEMGFPIPKLGKQEDQ